MDLGSGDGRTVITAAKRGATASRHRIQPRHGGAVEEERRGRRASAGKATFMKADLFETDLSKATVITMFLLPQINLKLRPTILNLKPGHARRLEHLHDGRLDSPTRPPRSPSRLHELVHGALVDRAGEGRRHVEAGAGRAHADAAVPESHGHAPQRQHEHRDHRQDAWRSDHVQCGRDGYRGRVNGTGMQGTQTSGTAWTATRAAR